MALRVRLRDLLAEVTSYFAAASHAHAGSDITSGTVAAARGGAGTVNGILKGDGAGTVSAVAAGGIADNLLTSNVPLKDAANTFTANQFLSTNGATEVAPRTIGMSDLSAGEAARFQFGDPFNALQTRHGGKTQVVSYYGVEIRGNKTSATAFAAGSGNDPSLKVFAPSGGTGGSIAVEGNVGVGLDNPISPLHVYTNSAANQTTAAFTDAGGKAGMLLLNTTNGSVGGSGGGILFGGNGAAQHFALIKALLNDGSDQTGGDLAISTRAVASDTALTERVRIASTGKIGLGAASPTYSLHVAPTVDATAAQTVFIQDATATTGETGVVLKAGAGDTADHAILQIQANNAAVGLSIPYVLRDAANDAAAAGLTPAVPVGGMYRNGSVLMIRVA